MLTTERRDGRDVRRDKVAALLIAALLLAGALAGCGGSSPNGQRDGLSRSSVPASTSASSPARSSSPTPSPTASPTPTRAASPTSATPGVPLPAPAPPRAPDPSGTRLHYAANDNFDAAGRFILGPLGFNLADVSSRSLLDLLPAGVRGLVYLGDCRPDDATFRASVDKYAGASKLYGFYLADEPEAATCPPANLRAEAAYIHSRFPGAVTFVLLQNTDSSKAPTFKDGYTPANTGIDLFGLDPYPCRSELNGCDLAMVGRYVAAANRAGIPTSKIVPVFQAFGGGEYTDDGGGHWILPTVDQARGLLAEWSRHVPSPAFDFVYSWGSQRGTTALANGPAALRDVFAAHNRS